jgi:uncharacterized membrane protein
MPDEVSAVPKTNRINPSDLMPILLGVVFLSILVVIDLTFPAYEATLAIGVLVGLFLLCCVTTYPRRQTPEQASRLRKVAEIGAVLLCGIVAGTALFTQHKWTILAIGIPWTAHRFARFLFESRDAT